MPSPMNRPLFDLAGAGFWAGWVPEGRRWTRVPPLRAAGTGAGGGTGGLTVLVRTLVLPLGTLDVWPQSGQRTVVPGETDVTSITPWQRGHFKIFAMVLFAPNSAPQPMIRPGRTNTPGSLSLRLPDA